jgi:thioesterase domain-containing protein/acyl carrier protein
LRERFQGTIPDHLLPSEFVSLESLPQTAGGKLDRRALSALQSPGASRSARREMPVKGVEQRLARIWESVLGQSNLSRHDNFFDLGGTSIHSAQIISRIQERFDVALSPSILVQHSTIEKLARVVSGGVLRHAQGPLVKLNDGGEGRPVFLVHSGEGDVAVFGQLARRLPDRPIFGLQSIGLNGEAAPLLGIPEMARRYAREVVAADPSGPYLLGGARMGALVAFEMAQQLTRAGRDVGLVAMLDFAPPRTLSTISIAMKPWSALRDRIRRAAWSMVRRFAASRKEQWLLHHRAFVAKMNCHSRHDYRPEPYSGPITLFVTADRLTGHWESQLARFSREARVVLIPGERLRMFGPPAVDELAARFRECL